MLVRLLEFHLDDGHGVVAQRGRKVGGIFSFARDQDFSGAAKADLVGLTSHVSRGIEGRGEDFRMSNQDVSVEIVAGLGHEVTEAAAARGDVLHGLDLVPNFLTQSKKTAFTFN